jgi:acyl-CoA hydrolase
MVELVEAGIITNESKTIDRGVSVANQARGSERLYRFMDSNDAMSMRPAVYTHDPRVLAEMPHLHAINTGLEVDLMGRINSEFVDGRRISSAGGLADFARAASSARDGHNIVALRATAKSGTRSRIVGELPGPSAVSLGADLTEYVVTEFGVARLTGLDSARRAEAMVSIADPAFRDKLAQEARTILEGGTT